MEEKILLELSKLNEKIDQKINDLDQKVDRLEQGMDQKIENKIESAKKEILDHYFLFEQEYGYKINAILDTVITVSKKSEEKAELIRQLDRRMSKQELRTLALEQRCFKS